MRLKIDIDLDNAAFHSETFPSMINWSEVVRVLQDAATRLELVNELDGIDLRDINGHTVGKAIITY